RVEKLRETWIKLRESREDDPTLLEIQHNADTELHHAICEMSANTVLLDTLDKIIPRAALIRRWVFANGVTRSYLVNLAEEHLEVLDAILVGDSERAAATMNQHLLLGQERAFKRLDSR